METAIDYEEKRENELKKFKFAPRTASESKKDKLKNFIKSENF